MGLHSRDAEGISRVKEFNIRNEPDVALAVLLGAVLLPALGVVPLFMGPEVNRYLITMAVVLCFAGLLVAMYALLRMPTQMTIGETVRIKYFVGNRDLAWNEIELLTTYTRTIRSAGAMGPLLTTRERLFVIKIRNGGKISIGIDEDDWGEAREFCIAHKLPLYTQRAVEDESEP